MSAVRAATREVSEAIGEIPTVLAKYYVALREANDRLVATLKPDPATYAAAEGDTLKTAIDQFEAAANKFREMEAVAYGVPKGEPLLSEKAKHAVGVAAIVMVILGGIFAAFGTGQSSPACTTLAYWFGFAAFALAGVWLFASFSSTRPLTASRGSAVPPSDLQYFVFGGMAFVVLGLLVAGVLTGDLLRFLQSIPGARRIDHVFNRDRDDSHCCDPDTRIGSRLMPTPMVKCLRQD